jgi:hypothetical protein
MSIEDQFHMSDKNEHGMIVTFDIIEDESGDTYWAYGHDITPERFTEELSRWLAHTTNETLSVHKDTPLHLDRLWAQYNPNQAEYFSLTEPPACHPSDSEKFPVTRVML